MLTHLDSHLGADVGDFALPGGAVWMGGERGGEGLQQPGDELLVPGI